VRHSSPPFKRCDYLLWNHAGADPIKAAEALIKLEAREARLLGLDMPAKVAITDPDGGGIPLEARASGAVSAGPGEGERGGGGRDVGTGIAAARRRAK
jgi:hypothetical protein